MRSFVEQAAPPQPASSDESAQYRHFKHRDAMQQVHWQKYTANHWCTGAVAVVPARCVPTAAALCPLLGSDLSFAVEPSSGACTTFTPCPGHVSRVCLSG